MLYVYIMRLPANCRETGECYVCRYCCIDCRISLQSATVWIPAM